MQTHNLKTWPAEWDAVYSGKKTFDLRKNDRAYVVGDQVNLWRWNPEEHKGDIADYDDLPCVSFIISYILSDYNGLVGDYVILGFKRTNALPNLSPAELERLAWLAEEGAEVIKAAMKIVRHGYDSYNPHDVDASDNRVELTREVGDFAGVVRLMEREQDVDSHAIAIRARSKAPESAKWLHHQNKATLMVLDKDRSL